MTAAHAGHGSRLGQREGVLMSLAAGNWEGIGVRLEVYNGLLLALMKNGISFSNNTFTATHSLLLATSQHLRFLLLHTIF